MALGYQVAAKERAQLQAEVEDAARVVAERASIVLAWDEREGGVPHVAMGGLRAAVAAYEAKAAELLGLFPETPP